MFYFITNNVVSDNILFLYTVVVMYVFRWRETVELTVFAINNFATFSFFTLIFLISFIGTNELHHQSKKPNMICSGTLDRKLRSASPMVMSSLPAQTSCKFRLGQQDDFKSSSSYSSYRDYRPRYKILKC